MLQLLPARVGMNRSPDLTLTGLLALTHWLKEERDKYCFYMVFYKKYKHKFPNLYNNAILECYVNICTF